MTPQEAIKILKPLFEHCKGKNECLGYIEHFFTKDEEEALDMAIKALGQTRWIPVSERLPEIDEEVLVFARCYFECSCYEEYIVKVRDACPEFCNGTNDNQLLDFGCKHGTCGNCEMENTGNDDKMFFTHMGVASRDKSDYWDSMDLSDDDVVIAWMPLPEKYKEAD